TSRNLDRDAVRIVALREGHVEPRAGQSELGERRRDRRGEARRLPPSRLAQARGRGAELLLDREKVRAALREIFVTALQHPELQRERLATIEHPIEIAAV